MVLTKLESSPASRTIIASSAGHPRGVHGHAWQETVGGSAGGGGAAGSGEDAGGPGGIGTHFFDREGVHGEEEGVAACPARDLARQIQPQQERENTEGGGEGEEEEEATSGDGGDGEEDEGTGG